MSAENINLGKAQWEKCHPRKAMKHFSTSFIFKGFLSVIR